MDGVDILTNQFQGIDHISNEDATVLTSLSPLPEQLITIWVSFSRVGHNLFNQAKAWDVSSAGIIPSSSLTSLKASKASWSVTDSYSALPISFKWLCSGPTPG